MEAGFGWDRPFAQLGCSLGTSGICFSSTEEES
jgi:hypothetical protein